MPSRWWLGDPKDAYRLVIYEFEDGGIFELHGPVNGDWPPAVEVMAEKDGNREWFTIPDGNLVPFLGMMELACLSGVASRIVTDVPL